MTYIKNLFSAVSTSVFQHFLLTATSLVKFGAANAEGNNFCACFAATESKLIATDC